VKKPTLDFTTEIDDVSIASDFGDVISSIIYKLKSPTLLLHFNTFMNNYGGCGDELMKIVKAELKLKYKVAIAAINNLLSSNDNHQQNAMIDLLL